MFRYYSRIAWRTIINYRGYSAINFFGLGVGIAGCLLILVKVQ